MPLAMAGPGDGVLVIRGVSGGGDLRRRLAELGFLAGERVSVVCEIGGNLILSVKGSRVALDRSLAQRIIV